MKIITLLKNKNFKIIRVQNTKDIETGVVSLARCLDFLFGQGTVSEFFVPICKELGLNHVRFMEVFWNYVSWKAK